MGTAQCLHRLQGFVDQCKNLLAIVVEFFTGMREMGPTANLVKELHSQRFFKLTYLSGDGRLTEMQLFSCTHIATMFCHDLKRCQLVQIQWTHERLPGERIDTDTR